MKSLYKRVAVIFTLILVTACSTNTSGWKRLPESQIDQKSYAIAYGAVGQTYADRVNESYDITSFIRGVDDWFNKKVKHPIEQIRASLLNRMLDHNVYAYYSGVLYAADLQNNFNRLSPTCWTMVQTPSITQGIYDAMLDIQANKVRHDKYIQEGADQILHLCVEQMENEAQKRK
ncbi:hypothetical protein Q7506_08440 [Glaesserella parasuis]|uniref:hypothetical protein n=1 Tax=Glaesserella parasuis TaxID=738 RepID=UPI00136566C0|nr:hypothetical protein [Glaesserella parasuis]MDG6472340.1 hypothetical protein [Glaesserella parasuis]MDO9767913.1 hypothetical protein [Glaesserella parasuis]MDO9961563.1 hypothetical protein [Glaesserella parasuis]MWQ15011.1 hypothetical protein [Glaesserella parasuis]